MNTENETGVKVPKGQINYNTVAGSLGLAAFAGLGLRNWLGNGNGSVAAGATAVAETQLVSGLMAELAKEKSLVSSVMFVTISKLLLLLKLNVENLLMNVFSIIQIAISLSTLKRSMLRRFVRLLS